MNGSLLRLRWARLVRVCRSSSTPHPLPLAFTPKPFSVWALKVPGRSNVSPSGTGAAGSTAGPGTGEAGTLPINTQARLGSHGNSAGTVTGEDGGLLPKISQQKVSTSFCRAFQGCWGCSDSLAGLAGAASLHRAVAIMDPPSWEGPGSILGWRQDG